MSSIFEKITLYDFFCYLIPGVTFESLVAMVLIVASWDTFLEIMKQISDYVGYLTVAVLLFGYLAGILLSELSRWISDKGRRDSFYRKVAAQSGCSAQVIYHALVCGGWIIDSEIEQSSANADAQTEEQACSDEDRKAKMEEPENKEQAEKANSAVDALIDLKAPKLIEKYINAMRGVLQSDKDYNRFHDYSSFATMCKNLSAAFVVAGVIDAVFLADRHGAFRAVAAVSAGITPESVLVAVLILLRAVLSVALPFLVVAFVLWIRYRRFEVKTGAYIVIWYVKKVADSKKNTAAEKTGRPKTPGGYAENNAR